MSDRGDTGRSTLSTGVWTPERLPTPLWHRVYSVLRERIVAGHYEPGERFPGEHEVMTEFGVARATARRALSELQAEGLVERGRGRGTRLRRDRVVREVRAHLEGLFENLLAMGLETAVRLVVCEERPAPAAIARAMRVAEGTPMLFALRLRLTEEGPFSHLETWVPRPVAARIDWRALETTPLLALLERAGVRVSRADQVVSVRLAEPRVAQLLEVPVGAPLLEIVRVVSDAEGHPVEHVTGLYRPDRYRLRLVLDREREWCAQS